MQSEFDFDDAGILLMFGVFIGCVYANSRLTLGPLLELDSKTITRLEDQKIRLQIVDILSLTFLVQLPIAMMNLFGVSMGRGDRTIAIFIFIATTAISFFIWLYGIRLMTRLKIVNGYQRFVLAAFCVPCGLVGGIFLLPALIGLVHNAHASEEAGSLKTTFLLSAYLVAIIAAPLLTHRICKSCRKLQECPEENQYEI